MILKDYQRLDAKKLYQVFTCSLNHYNVVGSGGGEVSSILPEAAGGFAIPMLC